MDIKVILAIILMSNICLAYNVSDTYNISQSGEYIVDEFGATVNNNNILVVTLPNLILGVLVLLFLIAPFVILFLFVAFLIKVVKGG